MRRLLTVLPAWLLATGLGLGQEQPGQTVPDKSPPPNKTQKGIHGWDVDEFIKAYDRNKDSFLSRDELPEQFRHNFDKIDINRDGKLSREELLKGMAHLQSRRRPSDVVFALVEMSDFDEGCAEELQLLYTTLRKMDKNGDGKLDAGELKAARAVLVEARVSRIFRRLDTDRDGKISRAEARGNLKKYFDEIDTNKDGFIDRAELMRAAAEKPQPKEKSADRPGKR